MDETALRRPVSGRQVMRAQLHHLLEAAALPQVSLQVVPFGHGGHAAAGGSFTILRFAEPALPDVVYIEHLTSALYLEAPADLDHYPQVMDHLSAEALAPPPPPASSKRSSPRPSSPLAPRRRHGASCRPQRCGEHGPPARQAWLPGTARTAVPLLCRGCFGRCCWRSGLTGKTAVASCLLVVPGSDQAGPPAVDLDQAGFQ